MELYCADCFDIMKSIPDESVNLILCDLPYGKTQHPEDKPLPLNELWKEYTRIIKPNGAILLFCQGTFFVDLVNSQRKLFRYDLVWDKALTTGFLNAKRMPLRQHEQIAVFYKSLPTYNPQFTTGKPLHGRGKSYLNKENINNNYGDFKPLDDTRKGSTQKYPTSILKFPKSHPSLSKHRTGKPVSLLEWLIKTYSNENDIVMDNCMGSGSCGVACIHTGRRFIGIEKNKQIFEEAKAWIDKENALLGV